MTYAMLKYIIRKIEISILILLVGGILFITLTPQGLRLSITAVSHFLPGKLTIQKIHGNMLGEIKFTNLDYRSQKREIYIHTAKLHWNPIPLLAGRIYIEKLLIDQVNINLKSAPTTTRHLSKSATVKPSKYLHLPFSLTLNNIIIRKLKIHHADHRNTYLDQIKAQLKTQKTKLIIQQLSFKGYPYSGLLVGTTNLADTFQTNLYAQLHAHIKKHPPLTITIKINGNLNQVMTFTVNINNPFNAHLYATFKHATQHGPITINSKWDKLLIPLSATQLLTSQNGIIDIHGTLNHFNIKANATVNGTTIPQGKWLITGHGNLQQLILSKITIHTLDGNINGNAMISRNAIPTIWNANLFFSHINLARKWPQLNTNINCQLKAKGNFNFATPQLDITLHNITGTWRTKLLTGNLNFKLTPLIIYIPPSQLQIGNNKLHMRGAINGSLDYSWQLSAPKLTTIIPNISGTITSSGRITGSTTHPKIDANLMIANLNSLLVKIHNLRATVNLNLTPNGKADINITGQALHYRKLSLYKLDLANRGTIQNHNLQANLITPFANYILTLTGNYSNNLWQTNVHKLDMLTNNADNWRLHQPLQLTIGPKTLIINPFCFRSKFASLCGKIHIAPHTKWDLQLTGNNIPATILQKLLPDSLNINTNINTNINLTRTTNGFMRGHATLATTAGQLIYQDIKKFTLPFSSNSLSINFNKQGLTTKLKSTVNNTSIIAATLNLPKYYGRSLPYWGQPINGKINIDFPYLNLLTDFIPYVSELNGNFKLNTNVAGTVSYPQLSGSATITHGHIKSEKLGIELTRINLAAKTQSDGSATIIGTANSYNNILHINGTTTFIPGRFPTKIKLKGTNIQFANTKAYKITASPDVTLTYQQPNFTLSGNILIPTANFTPQDLTHIVTLPSNVIIIKPQETVTKKYFNTYLDLKLIAGKNVSIATANLTAQLTGQIQINSAPLQPVTALGTLKLLKGKYNAYKRLLNIDKGSLIFTGGPINNPNLDVRATKTVHLSARHAATMQITPTQLASPTDDLQQLIVGVQATGPLQHPHLKLFSIPAGLSDANILSYLMFGGSAGQATGSQSQMLFQAAQLMGVAGTNVTSEIQKTFGLADFGVEEEDISDLPAADAAMAGATQQPAFGVGKYLGPRLYLHYSIGLTYPINVLNLTYYLTQRITIQTESSTLDKGADLFYTFQSN